MKKRAETPTFRPPRPGDVAHTITGVGNYFKRAIGESLKPRWMNFEVTDACNSRCKHCDIWRKKPTKDILTCKEIEKIFNDDLFRDLEEIIITGGEPTLRNDLKEIILAIHKNAPKAKILLSTNGLLPQRVVDVVKVAIEHGIHIDVGISLDGLGEKHDAIRGVKGNFEKVDHLFHELVSLRENHRDKIDLSVGFTLSNLTLESIGETLAYAKRLDVGFTLAMYEEASFYHNVGESLVSDAGLIKAVQSMPCSHHRETLLKALMGKSTKFPCFAMYTFCVLRCNGDIAPCLRLAHMRVGNAREHPPSVIWHSPAAKKARKLVKSCSGCLNTWATGWSFKSYYLPIVLFYIRERIRQTGV